MKNLGPRPNRKESDIKEIVRGKVSVFMFSLLYTWRLTTIIH